jgi:hypothetical protein
VWSVECEVWSGKYEVANVGWGRSDLRLAGVFGKAASHGGGQGSDCGGERLRQRSVNEALLRYLMLLDSHCRGPDAWGCAGVRAGVRP